MKIILLGYMASGKSTIGKSISKVLNLPFIDLDEFIEEKYKSKVSELFKTIGELFFRKVEKESLIELLESNDSFVLSLGGGTPCYYDNMKLILEAKDTLSFYLKTDIKELLRRIKEDENQRPLISHLKTDEDIIEFIGKHLFERSYYYNQADYKIDTSNNQIDVIQDIITKLY